MTKLKVGIAGFGKMGMIRHKSFERSGNVDLVSVFDSDPRKNIENISFQICESFQELLDSDIEAVFISAYVNVAAKYVLRALKSGKHVFCEKPPSMNADELKAIQEFQGGSNLILKYGFNHRHHYSVSEAKKIIEKGDMGKLLWMRGVYGKAGSIDFGLNWRNYRAYAGGGILMDQGIHMLDLFRYLSGQEFECVASFMDALYWDIESEDNAFLFIKTPSGVMATLHSTANQWRHKFLLEMTFENGYLNLDGILSSTGSYAPEKLIYAFREFEDIEKAMGKPKESISHFETDNSWDLELEEFIDAINNNAPIMHGTIEDAIEVMKLVDSTYANKRNIK